MTTFVLRNGALVEKHLAPLSTSGPQRHISDTMGLTWHPATGKHLDSKSAFRRMTRDSGCREVGNDVPARPTRAPIRLSKQERARDIKRAIDTLRSR